MFDNHHTSRFQRRTADARLLLVLASMTLLTSTVFTVYVLINAPGAAP